MTETTPPLPHESAAFFRNLGQGAGQPAPPEAAETALAAGLPPILDPDAPVLELSQRLGDLCHRLGLVASPVRGHLEEAIAVVHSGRPVLLLVRRPGGHELVSILSGDEATVRAEVLDAETRRELRMPWTRLVEQLDLSDDRLVALFGIETTAHTQIDGSPTVPRHPLTRLWQFVAPDRGEILIVAGFAVGLGVLALATPVAVQALVNFVAFGGLMQPLIVVGLLLLFFLAFAGAIRVFKFYVVEILQRRLFVRVVSELSARLPRVRLDVYDRGFGPELVNRFFDVLTIQKAGSRLLIDGLDIVLQAGIGLLVLGFYHPFLLLFDVLLIAAIAFILLVFGRGAVASAIKESSAKYAVASALEELARAPVTYKLAGAPEFARARLAELSGGYIDARRKHYKVVLRQLLGAVTLHAAAGTALLTLGGWLVIQGQLTLGQLVAAELIVSVALASFIKFGKQLEAFYDVAAAADKLGTLMDLPLEADRGESHFPGTSGAALELRHVSYCYHGQQTGLHDFSLIVEPSARVAVGGPRRAGKSTLADLATGLREPDSGVVLLDGADLRDIAKVSIRNQMELVKGFEIVDGSVLDNVRLGRSHVSTEQVRDALDRYGILEELLELPDGLRTRLSSTGSPLSRSTAQLLMLARASVGRPRAIVIDDVLDELDPRSLSLALAVLTDPQAPWSLLVFTSRTEICVAMDRTVELTPPSPAVAEKATSLAGART